MKQPRFVINVLGDPVVVCHLLWPGLNVHSNEHFLWDLFMPTCAAYTHLYLLNGLTRVQPNSSEKIRKRVQFYGHYITFWCWGRGGNFYLERIYFVCSGCVLIQFKGAMSHRTNVLLSLSLAACQPRWGFRRGEEGGRVEVPWGK